MRINSRQSTFNVETDAPLFPIVCHTLEDHPFELTPSCDVLLGVNAHRTVIVYRKYSSPSLVDEDYQSKATVHSLCNLQAHPEWVQL